MADVVISASQVIAAGQGYTVPSAQEITVRAVRASFNGAAAVGSYVPTLQIVGDSGIITAECPVGTPVVAGASADVSWFPGVTATSASVGTGIQFDTFNEGGWLWVQTDDQTEAGGTAYGIELRDHSSGGIHVQTRAGLDLIATDHVLVQSSDSRINIESDFTTVWGGADFSIQLKALTGKITVTGDGVAIQGAGGHSALFLDPSGNTQLQGTTVSIVAAAGGGTTLGGPGDSIAFVGATPAPQQAHPVTLADVITVLQVFGLVA